MRHRTLAPLAAWLLGCGGSVAPEPARNDGRPRSMVTAAEAAAARAACTFDAGAQPGLTLGRAAPLGDDIPLDTIVILAVEGRSFDHLFGDLPAAGQPDADVAPPGVALLDGQGQSVPRFHQTALCHAYMDETWTGMHTSWDDGRLDGFVVASEDVVYGPASHGHRGPADGVRAMGYYTTAELPYLYALASTFAVADRWFAPALGGTFAGRLFLAAGTTFGTAAQDGVDSAPFSIYDALDGAGIPWLDYAEDFPGFAAIKELRTRDAAHVRTIADFEADARAGSLPPVAFVDPELDTERGGGGDQLSPPGDVQLGEAFIARIATACMASPQWPRLALVVVATNPGGYYDHVAPPEACAPDAAQPELGPGQPPGDFRRLGFRVPAIVVSPWARPHSVSHTTRDLTSVLKLLEARFGLPAMTARDANADPLFDLFDFSAPTAPLLHPSLPAQHVDAAQLADCQRLFPSP